jgi:hypothetical protein
MVLEKTIKNPKGFSSPCTAAEVEGIFENQTAAERSDGNFYLLPRFPAPRLHPRTTPYSFCMPKKE